MENCSELEMFAYYFQNSAVPASSSSTASKAVVGGKGGGAVGGSGQPSVAASKSVFSRKCQECGQLNSRMAKKCMQCRSHLQGRACSR